MFPKPTRFKCGYLSLSDCGGFAFSMCAVSPVLWHRGLEWERCDLGSDLDSAAQYPGASHRTSVWAQFFSCQLGTITSVLSPWKSFGKCSVIQKEGGLPWGVTYHRSSIDAASQIHGGDLQYVETALIIQCWAGETKKPHWMCTVISTMENRED